MRNDSQRGIRVRVTERGLPVDIEFDPRVLRRPPEQLAREVVLLCRRAAHRTQIARRNALLARGVDPRVVDGLFLGTERDLVDTEAELRGMRDEDDE